MGMAIGSPVIVDRELGNFEISEGNPKKHGINKVLNKVREDGKNIGIRSFLL